MGRRWRVGIVGCGVAGLASAVALGRRGHAVTLIERAPKLAPVGAGLLLQPSGQLALKALGLLDQVIARAEPIEALHAWTHRGRTLVRLPYRQLDANLTGYGVHRGDLFQVLHDHAREADANFTLGVTIQSSRQIDGEIVAVDDAGNDHGPFDALIAADGSRSQVMWCWRLSNALGPLFQNEGRLLGIARDIALPWMPHVPGVGRRMVGTMAGLHTGIFSRLKHPTLTTPAPTQELIAATARPDE